VERLLSLRANQDHCFHGRFVLAADRNSVGSRPRLIRLILFLLFLFTCCLYVHFFRRTFCLIGIAVLPGRQPSASLDHGPRRSLHWLVVCGYLSNAGLHAPPLWKSASVSGILLGVWPVHRQLRGYALPGHRDGMAAGLLAGGLCQNPYRGLLGRNRHRAYGRRAAEGLPEMKLPPGARFLQKPFRFSALRENLRQLQARK
jgi:hypothetical protein